METVVLWASVRVLRLVQIRRYTVQGSDLSTEVGNIRVSGTTESFRKIVNEESAEGEYEP